MGNNKKTREREIEDYLLTERVRYSWGDFFSAVDDAYDCVLKDFALVAVSNAASNVVWDIANRGTGYGKVAYQVSPYGEKGEIYNAIVNAAKKNEKVRLEDGTEILIGSKEYFKNLVNILDKQTTNLGNASRYDHSENNSSSSSSSSTSRGIHDESGVLQVKLNELRECLMKFSKKLSEIENISNFKVVYESVCKAVSMVELSQYDICEFNYKNGNYIGSAALKKSIWAAAIRSLKYRFYTDEYISADKYIEGIKKFQELNPNYDRLSNQLVKQIDDLITEINKQIKVMNDAVVAENGKITLEVSDDVSTSKSGDNIGSSDNDKIEVVD